MRYIPDKLFRHGYTLCFIYQHSLLTGNKDQLQYRVFKLTEYIMALNSYNYSLFCISGGSFI